MGMRQRPENWLNNNYQHDPRCTQGKPLLLYIPPGQTITIPCPVHPEGHNVSGGPIVTC